MGRLLKKILYAVLGLVAVIVLAAIAFFLLFDPNDFRDNIAAEVQAATGRELVIEGDLDLSFFPWLAIDVGKSRLGNAPGFGEQPFATFERARLSVRLLPMLLRREVSIGTASLDGLQLNVSVARDGRNNWQDLLEANAAEPTPEPDANAEAGGGLDIAGVEIRGATVNYVDDQAGETYRLSDLNLATGRIGTGEPVELSADFDFELQPADLAGDFSIEALMALDTEAATVAFSDVAISMLGIDVEAEVAPFSYDGDLAPTAEIDVAAFSLKSLMQALDMEPIETVDPDALGSLRMKTTAKVAAAEIALDDLTLVVDDTTFTGRMSLARDAAGTITVELAGDTIDLNRYMAPATESASAGDEAAPVEIPADLIRSFNMRGKLTLDTATMAGITFENVRLGFNSTNGNLRMHPISAQLFDGGYEGDVRIDASGDTPALSVNETVSDVNVGALAKAMFEQDNITGTINGTFRLAGRGADFAVIQRNLAGTMSFELIDGTWEGRDIWYELRRARALLRKEPAPEPELPARTRFSTVRLSGPVTDGVFRNDDLLAELPFMQLTGKGSVDLPAATIDYRMNARVLERPELVQDATADELKDLTKTTIPLRITGPLAEPSIKPDLEAALKKEAEGKVRERLLDKVLGGDEEAPAEGEAPEEKDDKEKVKDALRDLLKRKE